jgi:hypothetical protein
MTALHRSEIGEVWIQPSLLKEAPKLFLVPPPDLKSKTASGIGCKSCDAFYNGYCSKGQKKFFKKGGLNRDKFEPFNTFCLDIKVGDRVYFYMDLIGFEGWKSGIVYQINQRDIILESAQLLRHGSYQLESPDDLNSDKLPVKKRRERGEGSGCIITRYCTKKGKSYKQYWYDYELWEDGICLRKGSAYIPKNKLEEIEIMNNDKKPVKSILKRLGKIV